MTSELFFGYFAFMIVLTSVLIIAGKNPVHSILWMLLMFFHIAGLYLFLNAEFMAAIQLIVYAGAILVLFIFVVFLLNLKREISEEQFVGGWPIGMAAAIAILMTAVLPMAGLKVKPTGPWSIEAVEKATHAVALGKTIYTEYLFPFEITSLILLVAIIGAVMLAKVQHAGEEEEK